MWILRVSISIGLSCKRDVIEKGQTDSPRYNCNIVDLPVYIVRYKDRNQLLVKEWYFKLISTHKM